MTTIQRHDPITVGKNGKVRKAKEGDPIIGYAWIHERRSGVLVAIPGTAWLIKMEVER
jgi:hypothetical protein